MAIFIVRTVSNYAIEYAVEAENELDAQTIIQAKLDNGAYVKETYQTHLSESVINVQKVGEKEFVRYFRDKNQYVGDLWTRKRILQEVNNFEEEQSDEV